MNYDYIRLDDVLAIHADQIKRYGGTHGVRDPGLLEAALFRPQTGYYPSLIEEAAALWESLSQNHPFNDYYLRSANVNLMTVLLGLTHGSATQHPIRENWLTAINGRFYRRVDWGSIDG